MIIWCFLVLIILACVTTIGFKYKAAKPIIEFKENIAKKAIVYAKENDKKNITVSVKKLKKDGYIKTNKIGDLSCNGNITVFYDNKQYSTKESVVCK